MRTGRKDMARKLIEKTFENIKILQLQKYYNTSTTERESIILDPKEIFYHAIENSTPILELQRIVKGGIAYQVQMRVTFTEAF